MHNLIDEPTTPPMNAKIKAEWVAKLRSGDFEQGKGRLRTDSCAYCCLGVLTHLYVEEFGDHDNDFIDGFKVLPAEVAAWAGLSRHDPVVQYQRDGMDDKPLPCTLAALNDTTGLTFEELADVIEAQL